MIRAYYQMDKLKSRRVMEAFAKGCDATLMPTTTQRHLDGDAVFYGVRPPWQHLWDQAGEQGAKRYMIDNAFFDAGREAYFRVGVNALQTWSKKPSDGERFKALGVTIQPWRTHPNDGAIYICPQSAEFMRVHHGAATWIDDTFAQVQKRTKRPAILRWKQDGEPFRAVLQRSFLVVVHSSAAAIEALLAGIPVITTDPNCAAAELATPMDEINSPRRPDGRLEWAMRLADSQWTLAEFANGFAWNAMNS